MKKTALVLMLLSVFSKILGFIREITLSYFYGASYISDAYLISVTIPGSVLGFIGIGIATNYIPLYSSIQKKESTQIADRFTNNVVNFVLIISSLIALISLIFTVPLVKLFASGFEGETLNLAVRFTRISIFGVYFSSLLYVFSGYLHTKQNFVIPALVGVPLNIFTIIAIVLSVKFNTIILAIGSVVAIASQLILLIPFVYKMGYRYSVVLDKNDKYLKRMVWLSFPVIMGVSVNQINVLVDRTIASQIVIGGITALTYANQLNRFIQVIFVMSIATVIYPMISKMAIENNIYGLKKSISQAIIGISLLIVPITVGSIIFAEPIVRLLFGRGAFDANAISMTSYALFFYSIGMLGFGLREVLSRAFYSLQDTKIPMINSIISVIINIVLNIILSKFLGIGGLALATSISAIFCTILLFISLRKKIGPFGMKNMTISFMKILCASLVMGLIAKITYTILLSSINANLSLILSIGIGAVTYFIIIYFTKIEEVDVIVNALKKKFKKAAI